MSCNLHDLFGQFERHYQTQQDVANVGGEIVEYVGSEAVGLLTDAGPKD